MIAHFVGLPSKNTTAPYELDVFSHVKHLLDNYQSTCYLYQSSSCGTVGPYYIQLYFSAFDTYPDDYLIT